MSLSRLEQIRLTEQRYHDEYYTNVKLFSEGSWLQSPVKSVMDTFDSLPNQNDLQLLDLGCGVGRNSIPLAQRLKDDGKSKVVCVDFLESAISGLDKYSREYGVSEKLELIQSDIGEFNVRTNQYDYIFSVSALEHLDTFATFQRVLESLQLGTKASGIHCFIINSNIQETAIDTGLPLPPMFEILFKTDSLLYTLRNRYANWSILRENVNRYVLEIMRDERKVRLESDVVTWIAQKSPPS
ncbi:class I SAM-dependent methyltransferase [Paenibacillus sp. NPDC058177]|uniref:class I SAM-dependent methyltransferase n=1 Tax=Paenibacillus sp. NPDC058177 TaxID=3346369 RepID=UPI0036DCB5B6